MADALILVGALGHAAARAEQSRGDDEEQREDFHVRDAAKVLTSCQPAEVGTR